MQRRNISLHNGPRDGGGVCGAHRNWKEGARRRGRDAVAGGVVRRAQARRAAELAQDGRERGGERARGLGDEQVTPLPRRCASAYWWSDVAATQPVPAWSPLRRKGPSARSPRSATPSTSTMRCSSVLPIANCPPSARDAAPPFAAEPLPSGACAGYTTDSATRCIPRGTWTYRDTREEGWTVTTKKDVSKK